VASFITIDEQLQKKRLLFSGAGYAFPINSLIISYKGKINYAIPYNKPHKVALPHCALFD